MRHIRKIALMAVGDKGWMGGIQYITNIVNALDTIYNEYPVEVHIFRYPSQQFHELEKFKRVRPLLFNIDETFAPFTFLNRLRWFLERRLLRRRSPRDEQYFIKNGYDFVYPVMLSSHGGKLNSAAWIADFQYIYHPNGASAAVTEAAERIISDIANNAGKIVYSSIHCEQDGYKFFPVTRGKAFAMPFSVYIDPELLTKNPAGLLEKYQLPRRYIMVSNLFAPTKNHKTLFSALGILRRQGIIVDLVCTGNIVDYRNLDYADEILSCITANGIRQQVHLLGLLPREDQMGLYRMAGALVQPSISEGWSTLVEEAKFLGKRIVLSDIPIHREQYPGNKYLFNPTDASELAFFIKQAWEETENVSFPEAATEQAASIEYREGIVAFGKNFLKIAASL